MSKHFAAAAAGAAVMAGAVAAGMEAGVAGFFGVVGAVAFEASVAGWNASDENYAVA